MLVLLEANMKRNVSKTVIKCVWLVIVMGFCLLIFRLAYLNRTIPEPEQNQDQPYTLAVASHMNNVAAETFRARDERYVLRSVEWFNNENLAIQSLQSKLKTATKIIACNPPTSSNNCVYTIAEFLDEDPEESRKFNEKGNKYFAIIKVKDSLLITIKGYDLNLIQDFEKWRDMQNPSKSSS